MSYLLPLYSIFFLVLVLALALFALSRSDETTQRKWARVRVRIDENRKQRMPPDEEISAEIGVEWLLASAALVLLLILLKAVH